MATHTIGSGARTYANPETFSDAVLAATTLTEQEIGECYNDSVFTGRYTLGTATTTASFNWILRSASGHAPTGWDDGVRFAPTTGSGHIFTLDNDVTTDEFLEMGQPGLGFVFSIPTTAGTSDECIRASGNTNALFSSCRFRVDDATTTADTDGIYTDGVGATQAWTVENCVFLNFERGGINVQLRSGAGDTNDIFSATVTNCAFYGGEAAIGFTILNTQLDIQFTCYNNVSDSPSVQTFHNTGASSTPTTLSVGDYNFEDGSTDVTGRDQSWPDAAGNTIFSGTFTDSLTPGAGTWHTVTDLTTLQDYDLETVDDDDSDTIGAGVGTTQAGVAAFDIDGNARPSATCDMGPWEKTAGAATTAPTFKRRVMQPAGLRRVRM